MKRWIMAVMTVVAGYATTMATEYYAKPGGTGNGSSYAEAGELRTLLKKLAAGDVLNLLGGQYDLNDRVDFNNSGTASQYIKVQACEGEQPILDFRQEPNKTNGLVVKGDYVHLTGLTIRYAGYKGIWLEKAKYCILERLDVYGCCNAGIQLRSGGHNTVVNCDSHDNFDYQDDGGNADGFADKQGDACPGNVYIGCRSWNNSDDGWDSFQRVTDGTPTVYINCFTYNNGPAKYDLTAHPRVLGVDAGLDCFKGKDLANFPNGGNPNGFKLGGKGTAHDTELYRCLAIGHRSKGFDQNNNAGNMKIINCTSYNNKINYGFGNPYAYTLTVKNCISLEPTGTPTDKNHLVTASSGTVTEDHNTWDEGFSVSAADFESTDVSLLLGARQADGSLPEVSLMRLKETATGLINRGVSYSDFTGESITAAVAYEGSAPDLGCYESHYTGTSGVITAVVYGGEDGLLPRYNLKGQRVDDSYHGIVIQGGQKRMQ